MKKLENKSTTTTTKATEPILNTGKIKSETNSLYVPQSINYFINILTFFIINTPEDNLIESYLRNFTSNFKNKLLRISECEIRTFFSQASILSFSFLNQLITTIQEYQVIQQIPLIRTFDRLCFWKNDSSKKILDTNISPISKRITVENYEFFDKVLYHQLSIATGPVLVLFTAAVNPLTGELWCSDCQRARPFLESVYNLPDITIIECIIQRIGYVNNPNHPYKQHRYIKLLHIPTIIWWKPNGPSHRLVEGELHDTKNIDRFLDLVFRGHSEKMTTRIDPEPEIDNYTSSDDEDTEEILFAETTNGCEDC